MADFELSEPFGIDGSELDGLTPQDCFVLGVEWQMVRALLDSPEGVESLPVHAANADRIRGMAAKRSRRITLAWADGDCSEMWMFLDIECV